MLRAGITSRRRRDDAGATLVEMLIAATLFLTLSTIVMGTVVVVIRQVADVKAETTTNKQSQRAFLRFDRQVRYAAALNRPVKVGNDWYQEFQTTVTGVTECAQWRLVAATDVLESRTWTVSGGTASGLTVWVRGADNVSNDPSLVAQQPFVFTPAGSPAGRQSLSVHLLVGSGKTQSETSVRLVARNSTPLSPTNDDANGDGVSDTQVCQEAGRA